MKKYIFIDIVSCLLIFLFLYTGLAKIIDLAHFRAVLLKSPYLRSFAPMISVVIPSVEIFIAIALLLPMLKFAPKLRVVALYSSSFLMAIFTLYVAFMLQSPDDLPCSCGGIIQKMNWHQHMYFNLAITILSIFAIVLNKRKSNEETNLLSLT